MEIFPSRLLQHHPHFSGSPLPKLMTSTIL